MQRLIFCLRCLGGLVFGAALRRRRGACVAISMVAVRV